jgi:hypothetical protein
MEEELFDVEDFKDVQEELEEILSRLISCENLQESFILLHSECLKFFNVLVTYVDSPLQEKVLNYARQLFDTADAMLSLDLLSFADKQKEVIIEAYEQLIENMISFIGTVFIDRAFDKISYYETLITEDRNRIEFAIDF